MKINFLIKIGRSLLIYETHTHTHTHTHIHIYGEIYINKKTSNAFVTLRSKYHPVLNIIRHFQESAQNG